VTVARLVSLQGVPPKMDIGSEASSASTKHADRPRSHVQYSNPFSSNPIAHKSAEFRIDDMV
jgi:hypothetical protein